MVVCKRREWANVYDPETGHYKSEEPVGDDAPSQAPQQESLDPAPKEANEEVEKKPSVYAVFQALIQNLEATDGQSDKPGKQFLTTLSSNAQVSQLTPSTLGAVENPSYRRVVSSDADDEDTKLSSGLASSQALPTPGDDTSSQRNSALSRLSPVTQDWEVIYSASEDASAEDHDQANLRGPPKDEMVMVKIERFSDGSDESSEPTEVSPSNYNETRGLPDDLPLVDQGDFVSSMAKWVSKTCDFAADWKSDEDVEMKSGEDIEMESDEDVEMSDAPKPTETIRSPSPAKPSVRLNQGDAWRQRFYLAHDVSSSECELVGQATADNTSSDDGATPEASEHEQASEQDEAPATPGHKIRTYVRPAVIGDMSQVAKIYNSDVSHSYSVPDKEKVCVAKFKQLFNDCQQEKLPFLVVVKGGYQSDFADGKYIIAGFAVLDVATRGIGGSYTTQSARHGKIILVVHRDLRLKSVGSVLLDSMLFIVSDLYQVRRGYQFKNPCRDRRYVRASRNKRKWNYVDMEFVIPSVILGPNGPTKEFEGVESFLTGFNMKLVSHDKKLYEDDRCRGKWLDKLTFRHQCRPIR
ncbi:hypothetical protein GGR54DRAFT_648308 [Hypoxylon sp. NC1633]|nr:hypothetical protein GGR54DRAFT_648308 [Hypoxylon sp. NC1633]